MAVRREQLKGPFQSMTHPLILISGVSKEPNKLEVSVIKVRSRTGLHSPIRNNGTDRRLNDVYHSKHLPACSVLAGPPGDQSAHTVSHDNDLLSRRLSVEDVA